MLTVDRIREVVQDVIEDYSYDGYSLEALNGKIHRTINDIGLDSLDLVEIVIAVEDEFGVELDDSKLETTLTYEILVEEIPRVLFNAIA